VCETVCYIEIIHDLKENEVQPAEKRMIRRMCGVKVKIFPSNELREIRNRWYNLGTTANRLRWCVLRKKDNDWVKKCMEYEIEDSRPRERPQRT